MDFFNHLVLAADLPTLGGIENWALEIVQQAIVIIIIFLVTKHLAKFKFGAIIVCCIVGGIVYFVVRNWDTVAGWIEAFMNKL
ncbi:hypothetical protein J32TS6_31100 [Virgibacillus pantothenticus]|uniref:Uncharacterized protein n=1 Tax=Virgibacillus pantothenticus TaxID=1473 RepID=A0A0L0QKZ5_VIRPA|nr:MULTISPECIES: TcpD family membrane protein [Bacillaceae]API91546.1 hypothetical protein BKP57_06660 [Virgibacillus sp. 6R]KNE19262.1 hypothetical protein AFK71_12130 [Virgibacillus pantothenticus]MBS7426938.1 hypothetical protein [Virgibacillus sp. 19R1-5]MCJ7842625.1 TcpD family membrane protein [Lederbergia sp. NSJ-179]MED3735662.1 TcpD family membrane protein [Virgibacillus pantothenticus]